MHPAMAENNVELVTSDEARRAFRKLGRNLFTPDPVGYFAHPSGLWVFELARGEAMDRVAMYGVTALRRAHKDAAWIHDLHVDGECVCRLFNTSTGARNMAAALSYVRWLCDG